MYLNLYVPQLQHEMGVVAFFRHHQGATFASSALMDPISRAALVAAIGRFVEPIGVGHRLLAGAVDGEHRVNLFPTKAAIDEELRLLRGRLHGARPQYPLAARQSHPTLPTRGHQRAIGPARLSLRRKPQRNRFEDISRESSRSLDESHIAGVYTLLTTPARGDAGTAERQGVRARESEPDSRVFRTAMRPPSERGGRAGTSASS